MGDRLAALFPLLILAALAGITLWLDYAIQPLDGPRTVGKSEPDYIVDGLSVVRMDPTGRVQHTLRALKMTHYPEDDLTLLVEPKFVTYSEGRSPVTVTSRHAQVSGNGDNVYFEEGVRVVRAPQGGHSELVMETEFLHVIPDENIAKTDKPVTIHDATGVVVATGLELNSETRVLKLQGRVKGTYDARGTAPR